MSQQSFAVPRAPVTGGIAGISAVFVLLAGIAHADLSSDEAAMLSWVDAHAGELEAFLERIVNINSGTMNLAGVREVGSMLRAEYEALGFATEWIDLSELNRAGHLFARHIGEPGQTVAIFEVSRILSEFYESVRGEQYLTFNAGTILGGTDVDYDIEQTQGAAFGKTNVVPQHVVVHGGLRTISAEQLERARSRMREIVGLGGSGDGAHSPGERLDLTSLPTAVKRAAVLVHRLANGER